MFKTNKNKQISVIKGTEKIFEVKWKNLKGIYLSKLSFFPCLVFLKNPISTDSKRQEKIYSTQYPV